MGEFKKYFQTPVTRIEIHWRPWTYKDVQEGTQELRVPGFQVATAAEDLGSSMEENILKVFPWLHAENQGWRKINGGMSERKASGVQETTFTLKEPYTIWSLDTRTQ